MQGNIISVSRRTDIPAFYSDWFMNRIREGYCYVPNPLYPLQKMKPVSLKPNDVKVIVFWTRNPEPLMRYLSELDKKGYKYYFQYTVIGYPNYIDPYSPSIEEAIKTFKELSSIVGKERVIWRYDPILLSNITKEKWHCDQIEMISDKIAGYTEQIVISFIDEYRKTTIRMKNETDESFKLYPDVFDEQSYLSIAKKVGEVAKVKGLKAVTCAEKISLEYLGIEHGKCIDDKIIEKVLGYKVDDKKDKGQRDACGCIKSRDIGMNNTCLFGCKYCYATSSIEQAKKNFNLHDKTSAVLVGECDEAPPKHDSQMELFK
jgi:DNA repair photolyase